MKIVVVSGSMRANSQSRLVADYLLKRLQEFGAETALIDLYEQKLPFYDDTDTGPWQKIWEPIKKELESAEGFVFVSPEWDGMFSAGLHNLFNYAGSADKSVLAHKPVTLVGVSSGTGGAYPLAQMRAVGPKNTHYVVSPENIKFFDVEKMLVNGEVVLELLRERADYSLKVLLEYAKALKQVRDSGIIDLKKFGNGV